MADIKVTQTIIEGLFIIEPIVFQDHRGTFFESYNQEEFNLHGLNLHFIQDNEVNSKKDVLRGMHVNIKHPQGKLIRVLDGTIFSVVIDLRKSSKTYLLCFSIELSKGNRKQLYIPEGMGHGYLAITDARILFKTTTHYIPNDDIGFAWDSKAINISWPITEPIQNDRDKGNKDLEAIWS